MACQDLRARVQVKNQEVIQVLYHTQRTEHTMFITLSIVVSPSEHVLRVQTIHQNKARQKFYSGRAARFLDPFKSWMCWDVVESQLVETLRRGLSIPPNIRPPVIQDLSNLKGGAARFLISRRHPVKRGRKKRSSISSVCRNSLIEALVFPAKVRSLGNFFFI